MDKNSLWEKYLCNKFPKLNKDIDVDVLIIGGGMTGFSSLYHLIDSNLKTVLVEKNTIGSGITLKSTAKITYLQENIYSKLKKYHNENMAYEYFKSQKEAINIINDIIRKNNIKCDIAKSDSYLYVLNKKDVNKLIKEKDLLEKFNAKINIRESLPDNTKVYKALNVTDTYVFNPVKYLNSLANVCNNKTNIYEETKIEKIGKKDNFFICNTDKNKIKAKYVILALHYPYFLYPFFMPLKTTLEKSYIEAYLTTDKYNFNAINLDKDIHSIRYYKDKTKSYKIHLTASHNICLNNNEKENFNKLNNNYKYRWSNIDIITNDYLPFIGEIDKNLLIGTGYNTWGMTNSTIAGKILSDIILEKNNNYIKLFNPKRNINTGKVVRLPLIISSNTYSFINSMINKKKSWYKNNISIKKLNGKTVATYKDDKEKLHTVYLKCPHLGCNLVFNEVEKTWDCPCHGSRFDIDGKCILGPSNYNISYKQ